MFKKIISSFQEHQEQAVKNEINNIFNQKNLYNWIDVDYLSSLLEYENISLTNKEIVDIALKIKDIGYIKINNDKVSMECLYDKKHFTGESQKNIEKLLTRMIINNK